MYIRPRKLIDYLEIIWKRKGTLFLMMTVMLIATFIVIKGMPKIYQSKATVIINKQDLPEELGSGPSFESVKSQLKSRSTSADIVTKHRLYPATKKLHDAVTQLESDVVWVEETAAYLSGKPVSIKLSFKYSEAATCEKVLTDLIGRFDDANRTISRMAASEANRITEEIGKIQSRLRVVAPRNDLAMLESGMRSSMAATSAITAAERRTVMSQIQELRDREYRLSGQIAEGRRLIGEQESIVRAQEGSVEFNNPAASALLLKRTELNAQLLQFRSQYTDRNPKVIGVQTQLDQVNRELELLKSTPKSAAAGPSAASMDLRRMKQELRNAETDLEVSKMDISRKERTVLGMPTGGSLGIGIDSQTLASLSPENKSEYERLIAELNTLASKREGLFRLGDIGRSGNPIFKIVERPIKPDAHIGPNRVYLMTVALGLSLIVALLTVFALEMPSIVLLNNERDVEYFLGAPVLAYIPETVTPLERTRYRRLSWARGLLFLLLTPGLIFLLVEIFTRFGVFSMLAR